MTNCNRGLSPGGVSFAPLLFAGDINVYSVARAFHEAFGIRSKVFGKYMQGPCLHSRIIDYTADSALEEPEVFVERVCSFAEQHRQDRILLIGCGDSYVQLASAHRESFPENVIVPSIDAALMAELTHKEQFYNLCAWASLSGYFRAGMGAFSLPFEAPYIVKPSSGTNTGLIVPDRKNVQSFHAGSQSILADVYDRQRFDDRRTSSPATIRTSRAHQLFGPQRAGGDDARHVL